MLFRLNWFFIYSNQFLQNSLYVSPEIPENRCIIHWRLLLNGLRSVLVNATDKPFRLKNLIVSNRDLVPHDRMTCVIAFRLIFFVTKRLTLDYSFLDYSFLDQSLPQPRIWCFSLERFLLHLQACTQCNQHSSFQKYFIISSKHRNGRYISISSMLYLYQP